MRISDVAYSGTLTANLAAQQSAINTLDTEESTGSTLNKPSDNPFAVTEALGYQRQISQLNATTAIASTATSWLNLGAQTANSVLTTYQTVRTLALQALNSGTQTASSYSQIATQLTGLKQQLVSLANTTFGGTGIFSGTADTATPYSATGAYSGNSNAFTMKVGSGPAVQVAVPGTAMFGGGTSGVQSVFTTIDNMISHLGAGPSGTTEANLQADLSSFDANVSQSEGAAETLGNNAQRVQDATTLASSASVQMQSALSNVASANITNVVTELQLDLTHYQAALATTAQVVPLSLASYLK